MKRQHITILVFAASIVVVSVVLAAQSQDQFTLKQQTALRSQNSEITKRGS